MSLVRTVSTGARRLVGAVTLGLLAAALSIGLVASPAAAASWTLLSSKQQCHTYSFGTACTVTKTWKRTGTYCAKPPSARTAAGAARLISWSNYCIRYSTTTIYK